MVICCRILLANNGNLRRGLPVVKTPVKCYNLLLIKCYNSSLDLGKQGEPSAA